MRTARPHNLLPSPAASYSSYTPYGYRATINAGSRIAYAGEWLELLFDGYFLGNGYRLYSTVLMRFISPDSLSPFGRGGLGSYCYCGNDPINNVDPSGHMFSPAKANQKKHIPITASASAPTPSKKATTQLFRKGLTSTLLEQKELQNISLKKIRNDIQKAMSDGNIELAIELNNAYSMQSEAIKTSAEALNKLYSPEQTPSETHKPQTQEPANLTKIVRQDEN